MKLLAIDIATDNNNNNNKFDHLPQMLGKSEKCKFKFSNKEAYSY